MSNNFNKGRKSVDDSPKTNKSLLIVKSQAQNLVSVENFLRNRDWKIFSTTSLKDALQHMISHQPAFVMITVDHPNKKVRNLPKILAQAFPCCVIAFAENSASASYNMLTESKSEYLLYPPVTGPAVERTVNKFYKDQAAKQSSGSTDERGTALQDQDGGAISIKGGGLSAQSLLAQMLGEDNEASAGLVSGNGAPLGQAAYTPQFQNSSQTGSGPGYVPQSSDSSNSNQSSGGGSYLGPTYAGGPGSSMDPSGYGPNYASPEEAEAASHRRKSTADYKNSQGLNPEADTTSDPSYGGHSAESKGHWQALPPKEKRRTEWAQDEDGSIRTKNHQDSIILRGTKEALDKSVYVSDNPAPPTKLEQASNVACIVIESSRFSGYLVAAMSKDRKIDDAFVQRIRERLFSFLAANGEPVSEEESMGIKIKEVPFEEWALECAEFLRKSVHDGNEVAMAFFPCADVKAKVGESANEEMVAVNMDDIKTDVPVEFNLYIYLPANQKYVLYTPRGGKVYANQKDKLTKQGIKQMHMLKHDIHDFNKYRAQNYLNGKIEEFENIQKVKKIAS